jgi:dipeptidyl aminopeptidase/acylaminoacyl peptidase
MTRSRFPFALALAAAPLAAQSGAPPAPAPSAPSAATAATAVPAQAPQAPPDTEIFVADLVRESGAWRVERPRNVTRRVGYDNQPWFLPDGQRLLYTSQRGESSDIFELDLATGRERQLTATPESEYSPQLAVDGRSIVVVRVEADTTQRLWRFPLAPGGAPTVVAPEVKGVGYHAWADADTFAVFVLGQPFTLRIVELGASGDGSAKIVASGVGRSIHRVRGTHEVSYTAPDGDRRAIFALDPATGESRKLAPAPPTEEGDYAWTPDGALLAAVGSKLFRAVPGSEAAWTEIADLTGDGVGRISRLAVSPIGDQLALVAQR